ncbi:PEP-utilizing enzyme [Oceanirhabdus seepicola]|uniref:PEP-utilising enzyme mobile domain-containing protein n=1 Tax=Oceanirhabdus seepicola TaxID=2828781 RepID=A0A9J6NY00_9CLOT|nr:PEP-utilizing enzyme [Oceanirhabdus seepicola]MCM1988862.1 hypothetical protein [Oceanirhabdus seepicola]
MEKQVNEKKIAVLLKSDGGIVEKANKDPKKQALTDDQIFELSKLIKNCEKHYGKPMDTEWAFEGGKLYLLQSRPITTHLPLFSELLTEPGADKLLYLDSMGMTQGITDSLSVLGTEIWAEVMEAIKGALLITSIDGTMPTLHGRQYFNLSNLQKGLGEKIVGSMTKDYDANVKKILADLDMSEYMPSELPESLKGIKGNVAKMSLKFLPPVFKVMFGGHEKPAADYINASNSVMNRANNFSPENDFNKTTDKAIEDIGTIMNTIGIMLAGMISIKKINKMFKGHDVENEITALSMDLDGNPTSEMGHLMFKLASYDELQNTKDSKDFVKKINKKSYSNKLLTDYNEFIDKFGVRGFKEIDIASPRAYEDIGSIYDRLKEINIESSQISNVKQKRKESYDKLYAIAKEGKFEKKFVKQAEIYQATFGYREHPKYVVVYVIARLHDLCLKIGKQFVNQGRLENAYQIFDLHKDEITKAQKDKKFDLMKLRDKNLAPYKTVEHVKDWPLVIDSRGKIFKPKMEIKDGDLVGTPIAVGKIRGRAKVLHSPYEKPLNPGEILVTTSTEPSWTPIFINAAGVVMEIGGPLQHGGIIAREYGIPCVSGLMGIMDIVKDGDLLEVDGTNGIVKIVEEAK